MSVNNKRFLANQIFWIGISFGLSIAISIVVPFPISLVAIIGVFILLNFSIRKIMIKKIGIGGRESVFGGSDTSSLKYYCMSCGTAHREPACPKCGSKMKRVGS